MSFIKILSEDVANKIAAGEVVERPSSVVKELVENSIDAQCSKVSVLIQQGGKQKIIVIDDGIGMDYDDALLAFERHSTSKISGADDLNEIKTLGFRGEALPSIASVCYFTLETKTRDSEIGTKIFIAGGKIKSVQQIASPAGTKAEVYGLFFNMPARKKFLKSASYESSLVSNIMINYALAYPGIHFYFKESDKNQFDFPKVNSYDERIYQIYGKNFIDQSIPLFIEKKNLKISGRVGFPSFLRPNRNTIHFFVNKRYVRDRLLMNAFMDVYKPYLKEGTFPFLVAYFELPWDLVDVNVHPSKMEIRFLEAENVYASIKEGVKEALSKFKPISIFPIKEMDQKEIIEKNKPAEKESFHKMEDAFGKNLNIIPQHLYIPTKESEEKPTGSLLSTKIIVIAQYKNCYILAYDNDGLLLIDQHVAHERILYEEFKKLMNEKKITMQHLLLPLPVEVSPTQKILIQEYNDMLQELGFILEPFGGNTFLLKAIPYFIKNADLTEMIIKIIDDFQNAVKDKQKEELVENLIASVACRAAIKINMSLNREKMEYIVEELMKTSTPQVCPHGRPIIMKITDYQIDKNFKRK